MGECEQTRCNFLGPFRVVIRPNKGKAVVGKSNIVGSKSRAGDAGQPNVNGMAATLRPPKLRIERKNSLKTKRICGAMSQQRGDTGRGNQPAPQKLVQLVGYRDPKPRPDASARARRARAKWKK